MHHFSLADLQEYITFNGYNFNEWIHILRVDLKRDNKLYILEGPIHEPPTLSRRPEHDTLWKNHCDVDDVSDIIPRTIIPDLRKDLENLKEYHMFHQVKRIFLKYNAIWF